LDVIPVIRVRNGCVQFGNSCWQHRQCHLQRYRHQPPSLTSSYHIHADLLCHRCSFLIGLRGHRGWINEIQKNLFVAGEISDVDSQVTVRNCIALAPVEPQMTLHSSCAPHGWADNIQTYNYIINKLLRDLKTGVGDAVSETMLVCRSPRRRV
jgi:hypothetical protein